MLEGNLQIMKWHHHAIFLNEVLLLSLKRTTRKHKKHVLQLLFAATKNLFSLAAIVISHLCWYGLFCPSFCFRAQQESDYPVNYKARLPEVSIFTKVHVPNRLIWEREKQPNVCQVRLFSRHIFVSSLNEALKITHFNFGWCTNWNFTVRICSTTALWKRRHSRLLIFFIRRRWRFSDSGSESKCPSQKERKLGPDQNMDNRSSKKSTRWGCSLWACAQFSES